MASLQCQNSSPQYISHAFIQRWIASIDHHLTSHVSGICAGSLEVRSCSGSAHQAAHQNIQAGTTCTKPNYAKWDLNLVLSALMRPPFASEVDDRGRISDYVIDLRLHMMKTVFLQAFASAQRWSYLHALSVVSGRCVFGRGNIQRQSGVLTAGSRIF